MAAASPGKGLRFLKLRVCVLEYQDNAMGCKWFCPVQNFFYGWLSVFHY